MAYHIITILGMAGFIKRDEKIRSKSFYSRDSQLDILFLNKIKEGEFYNSTHCLFESFKTEEFDFITTKEALEYQNELFENEPRFRALLEGVQALKSDDFEEIFGKILEFIEKNEDKDIILDITHGLHYQSIIASFASIVGKTRSHKNISIIFAKELENQKYQYISLDSCIDKYLEISLISIALNSFVQTFSVPRIDIKDEFIEHLRELSKALQANAITQMFKTLDKSLELFEQTKRKYASLGLSLDNVKKILDEFKLAKDENLVYKKYFLIAKFMFRKQFYLNSATCISEALSFYLVDKFIQGGYMLEKKGKKYEKVKEAGIFIKASGNPNNIKNDRFQCFVEIDKLKAKARARGKDFHYLKQMILDITAIRNDLAHIGSANNDLGQILSTINSVIWKFEAKCINEDILKGI